MNILVREGALQTVQSIDIDAVVLFAAFGLHEKNETGIKVIKYNTALL
ncbi:MAG TPA: hypothetical protein VGB84_10155 [Arachidicoccus sp.]